MIYRNDDPMAIIAMEADRLGGDYCYEAETQKCPVCGAYEPDDFYINDEDECIGCTDCVHRTDVLF